MILIDAVFINSGGGLVLLKALIDKLKYRDDIFFLFDKRTVQYFDNNLIKNKKFISNSLLGRHFFYLKNLHIYDKVFCFGNIPPTVRLKAQVYVYFHQPLFLESPCDFSFKDKFIYSIKRNILKIFKNNSDLWIVQSEYIKSKFSAKYFNSQLEGIIKAPFYPELNFSIYNTKRELNSFLYVSNSTLHKNHYRLIESFCLAYNLIKKGSLTVTVPESDINLCELIHEKIKLGYPIKNVGFIDREKLTELYLSHEYLIFPSLAESFGLGLAEAIDGGCKIIAADLSYTYEVCEPSLVFDPISIDSIQAAIVTAIKNELPCAKKLIENDLSKIMQLLVE
ncbi:glycosyltransferase [Acinetobacter lwoffii]|uniref:glycosyltransferase n=1 Tax=Acinetobacter lwoffii TaxID=28090 RepID=UPI00209AB6BC|nr:glycosyltransferase [Acinetobacter lwoffii]MCO8097227.1 glycosyltransferase [Acinetobacter lwoffii]